MGFLASSVALSVAAFLPSLAGTANEPTPPANEARAAVPLRAGGLNARIDTSGLEVDVPSLATNAADERVLAVETLSFGRVGRAHPVESGALAISSARTEIRRAQFVEWFHERLDGVEQGWTVPAQPERGADAADLWIGVRFRGLWPQVSEDGRSSRLVDEQGNHRLSYRNLRVTDSAGRNGRDRAGFWPIDGNAVRVSDYS